jgi:hypothetical protein
MKEEDYSWWRCDFLALGLMKSICLPMLGGGLWIVFTGGHHSGIAFLISLSVSLADIPLNAITAC